MRAFAPGRVVAIAAIVVAASVGAIVLSKSSSGTSPSHLRPTSFAELIALPEAELAKVDIALMNLLCAEGLPGAENLDVQADLKMLDQWAEAVQTAEREYSPQYFKNPDRYDRSYSKFKAVNLALTLKQDLGCGYNMDLVTSGAMADIRSTRFYRDSKDIFLHGFTERRKGSCASLPVLTVAVGRRCGYPLVLVTSKGHLFCRWDDGKEQFNLETAAQGVDSKPDSYYRQWPHPFDQEEAQVEKYLKSLNPSEELGVMAQTRAACLQENQRLGEAAQAYEVALRSFPESKLLKAYLSRVKGER